MAAAKGFALGISPTGRAGIPRSRRHGVSEQWRYGRPTPAPDGTSVPPSAWRFPVAVFELENSRSDARVAYSLWKTLCVRAPLRAVFVYRPDWESGVQLVQHLGSDLVGVMPIDERSAVGGDTLIVLGSRGEGETFPTDTSRRGG